MFWCIDNSCWTGRDESSSTGNTSAVYKGSDDEGELGEDVKPEGFASVLEAMLDCDICILSLEVL
jgi:hypothetical protein